MLVWHSRWRFCFVSCNKIKVLLLISPVYNIVQVPLVAERRKAKPRFLSKRNVKDVLYVLFYIPFLGTEITAGMFLRVE